MATASRDELRTAAAAAVDRLADRLVAVSHRIHDFAELQFEEHRSADALTELAAGGDRDAVVETGLADLPTAFKVSLPGSSDGPHIAFVGEYDALPEIGHGCGHNIIGTAAAAAFLAVSAVVDDLPGSVSVVGTPAEEGGGGKAIMVDRGVFDDVDAAFLMHPSWATYVCPRLLGMRSVPMHFSGVAAHAGQSPYEGRSALNGVIQTFNSVDAMRHHMHPDARMHGVITEGGRKPSVIPDRAACHFYVRAPQLDYLNELVDRVVAAGEGAATATQTTVTIDDPEFPAYEPYIPSTALNDVYRANAIALGEDPITLDTPYVYASNDIGNVSRRLPVAMMMFGITGGKHVPHHSREFEGFAKGPLADRALVVSAKAMASSAVDLLGDADLLDRAQREREAAASAAASPSGTGGADG